MAQKPSKKINKRNITITIVVIAVILIIDLTFTGFLKFGYNVVRCGGLPVAVSPGGFAASRPTYVLPGHYTPGWANTTYLCSEQQAIDSGIQKSLYD